MMGGPVLVAVTKGLSETFSHLLQSGVQVLMRAKQKSCSLREGRKISMTTGMVGFDRSDDSD